MRPISAALGVWVRIMGQLSGNAVSADAMSIQPRTPFKQSRRFADHQCKELGQSRAVVFVLVVDGIAQLTDRLPLQVVVHSRHVFELDADQLDLLAHNGTPLLLAIR